MRKNDLPLINGLVFMPYWILFYVFVFKDLYLSWSGAGQVLKAAFPVAAVANVVGASLAVFQLATGGKRRAMVGILLNGAPLLVGVWFLWWLIFGVRI